MQKITISILIAVALIGGAFLLSKGGSGEIADGKNVSIVDGKQIIDLTVRGSYSPVKSIAKAGVPTILRFTTNGTFSCASSVRIPSMNISRNLASTGTTDIDLGSPTLGVMHGSCGMGMYPFEINFQ